ncbi:putative SEC12-like protein 1-like [Capsicum annuum]|uniref:Glycosyl transferase 64 domain-containing protein n=1 Tax=Capsicum annuum TaxID=4072 RepID=A0A2G2ZJV8_CAPAN|nr:putative SEC12-like protein 1-like [Capsicum annuum]PHT82297.1 hypothetical protein T459_15312 [Capsicum annuum]
MVLFSVLAKTMVKHTGGGYKQKKGQPGALKLPLCAVSEEGPHLYRTQPYLAFLAEAISNRDLLVTWQQRYQLLQGSPSIQAEDTSLQNRSDSKEVEVQLGLKESIKGRNAWNGIHLGCASVLGVAALVILFGVSLGAAKGLVPLSWCPHNVGKRSDISLDWEQSSLFYSRMRLSCSHLNRASTSLRDRIKPNTCSGSLVLTLIFFVTVVLMCTGVKYLNGGSGAHEAYPLHGQYSQFTLLTMTYDAGIWNLKMYVQHYSRCSSVREIVVVWNKGQPPELSEFNSTVPTRAVLELDDDIMMPCDDVERGFKVWREHPERIVGFYPRLANGSTLKYRAEKHARKHNGYNMILTGAAFMDSNKAFELYWSKAAAAGRDLVDSFFVTPRTFGLEFRPSFLRV